MEPSPPSIVENGNKCHGNSKQIDYEEADVGWSSYQKKLKVYLWEWKEWQYRVHCSVKFKTIVMW